MFKKSMTKIDTRISNILITAEKKSVTKKELIALTGYSDREIKQSIRRLRESYPIIGIFEQPGGYKISYDSFEISKFIKKCKQSIKGYEHAILTMNQRYKEVKDEECIIGETE